MIKEAYAKPALTDFGSVAELTRGNAGSGTESGPNSRKANNE